MIEMTISSWPTTILSPLDSRWVLTRWSLTSVPLALPRSVRT